MMVERIFTGYDKDGSGKLEFAEFRQCLKESQLGLSDKQISYLMSVSDTDEDGTIDCKHGRAWPHAIRWMRSFRV